MNFVNNVKFLITKLCKQNFNKRLLMRYVNLFLNKFEFQITSKFLAKIPITSFTN